jgi:hypothetical protein
MIEMIAITFDVDYTDYFTSNYSRDEMEEIWPFFTELCKQYEQLKTTWFIRIDEQIESIYGLPDFIFKRHQDKINWLLENGHEVGWHFHSYVKINQKWIQNTNDLNVSEEMIRVFPYVKKYDLSICRMGWTYHTNRTMKTLFDLGIKYDFSAFPRPKYSWDLIARDWVNTPENKYKPSIYDYRKEGEINLGIEVYPITTIKLPLKSDTEPNVVRYLNPAYKEVYFEHGLRNYQKRILNTVTHPYEVLPSLNNSEILAFSSDTFNANIKLVIESGIKPITATELFKI